MKEITVKSNSDNLSNIITILNENLEKYNISLKSKMQLELAIEEIFVNIVNYAYEDEDDVKIIFKINEDPLEITIRFIDNGISFNPLTVQQPDLELSSEEREIGGLGLFLVKKNVDDIYYEYKDNYNILTIKKVL